MKQRDRRQRGVALLTAMLILALVAIIGTAMLSQMNVAVHRSGNIWNSEQAWWYGIGVENWIGAQLRQDARHSKIDTLAEAWAQPVNYLPIDGGSISGRVIDLQGRFNLNNLALGNSAGAQKFFERLIENVTGTDQITATTIAQATADWVDADINPTRPYGAEDDYYLGQTPAYRAANTLMASPSELRLVKGVTAPIYSQLAPYLCALPSSTPINVDTAPAAVLQALAADLPAGTGQALVAARSNQPWKSTGDFLKSGPMAGQKLDGANIAVTTQYFQIDGTINVGQATTRFYAVLRRAGNGAVHVIRHSTDAY